MTLLFTYENVINLGSIYWLQNVFIFYFLKGEEIETKKKAFSLYISMKSHFFLLVKIKLFSSSI